MQASSLASGTWCKRGIGHHRHAEFAPTFSKRSIYGSPIGKEMVLASSHFSPAICSSVSISHHPFRRLNVDLPKRTNCRALQHKPFQREAARVVAYDFAAPMRAADFLDERSERPFYRASGCYPVGVSIGYPLGRNVMEVAGPRCCVKIFYCHSQFLRAGHNGIGHRICSGA